MHVSHLSGGRGAFGPNVAYINGGLPRSRDRPRLRMHRRTRQPGRRGAFVMARCGDWQPIDTALVQAFEMHRKRLLLTTKDNAPSESAAMKRAEAIATRKAGVAVIRITGDDETFEVSEAKVLARFGDVPDDLDQMVSP